jgi:hypothetical protein
MVRKFVAVLFALALIGASVSAAQVGIGVSGQYLSLSGSDFDGVDAGFGVEGNVLFPVGTSFRLGASAQWSTHGLTGSSESLDLLGVLAEGRYMFGGGGKMTPYLGARGGWGQYSVSSGGSSAKATGYPIGGGGGLMIAMSPSLAIDVNAMFHTVSFGNAKVDGTEIPDSKASGTALQVRAGINFKLGGQ